MALERLPALENGANWKKFERSFLNCIEAFFEDKKDSTKVAILLNAGGDYLLDIYESLNLKKEEKFLNVIKALREYFVPKVNITFERFKFFTCKQAPEQSYEGYMTLLKNLSETCAFGNIKDELVRDVFVTGIIDSKMQEALLIKNLKDADETLQICRARTVAMTQANTMKIKEELDVNLIKKNERSSAVQGSSCSYCSYQPWHPRDKCPAKNSECYKCHGRGHFSRACKKKGARRVRLIENQEIPSNESEEGPGSI